MNRSPAIDHREWLIKRLKQDPQYALELLDECLQEEELPVFLTALKDVADSFGGIRELAKKTKLSREHLFRMLSKNGNPRLENLRVLLKAFGWRLTITKSKQSNLKKAA